MPRRFAAFAALVLSLLLAPAAAQAAVSPAASASIAGNGSASAELTVPAGSNRFLTVGVSTIESATVTSVTYGAQVLTREHASAKDSSRAEVWTLKAPNPGTANVVVTVTGGAPIVIGATAFTGVDQTLPIIASASENANYGSNSASLVLNQNVEADGMFGVISINDADNITAIRTTGSVDTVVADKRWSGAQGSVLGAGATRRGWTGQNLSINAGINWYWNRIDPSHLMPYSNILTGLRAATTTAPAVGSPIAHTITHDSATLTGTVVDTGGEPVTERGAVYCRCANPTVGAAGSTTLTAGAGDVGPFEVAADSLTPSTTYTFRAFATNAKGTTYTASTGFTTAPQPNRAPTADAGGPYSVAEGSALTLDGSATDADGDALTYRWDVDGDGTYGDATGATPTLTPAQLTALGLGDGPKSSSVRVQVSDGELTTTSAATILTIGNVAPTATLANSGPVDEGETAQVSWSGVTDPATADAAAGTRYAYDFDDDGTWDVGGASYATATTAASVDVPAAITADGDTDVTVRAAVVDKDSGAREYTTKIEVDNVAPTATLNGVTVDEGKPATVAFSAQDDVSAADRAAGFTYEYDTDGDGTFEVKHNDPSVTIATADGPATREITGAIIDRDGGRRVYKATVTIENVAPTATLNGDIVDEGSPATVTFTDADDASSADKAAGFSYEFDLDGDGTFEVKGTDPKATLKTTDGPATLPVKGAIVDRDGGRRGYSTTVVVRNVVPTLALNGAGTATAGAAYALTLAGADAGGDALTGTIHWGDGTSDAYAAAASHVYGSAGSFTVTVTVRDKDGAEVTATHAVTVAAAPAAPAPATGVLGAEATNLKISGVRVTPRCIRATGLRAVTSAAKTIKVQFRVSTAANVTFSLERWADKRGASKCPPSTGVAKKGGQKVPGVYSPFSDRAVKAKTGLNTVTLAATGRKGKALKPGTYLLTITAGEVTARTKVWVLAK